MSCALTPRSPRRQFYEYGGGSVFQVAADANGVTYSPTTAIATPKTSADSGSSSTTSTSDNGAFALRIAPAQVAAAAAVVGGVLAGALGFF